MSGICDIDYEGIDNESLELKKRVTRLEKALEALLEDRKADARDALAGWWH